MIPHMMMDGSEIHTIFRKGSRLSSARKTHNFLEHEMPYVFIPSDFLSHLYCCLLFLSSVLSSLFFFSLVTKEQPDFDNGLKRVNETMIKGDCCEKFIFENIFFVNFSLCKQIVS